MSWLAVVPFKAAGARKSRLAAALDAAARDRLALDMLAHVGAMLDAAGVTRVLLSPAPEPGWLWERETAPLNLALEAVREARMERGILVLHADLPLLAADDIHALIAATAATGLAIGPDRHGTGTNGVAAAPGMPIRFRFGADSGTQFIADNPGRFTIVHRPGLALDIDTPADLSLMRG